MVKCYLMAVALMLMLSGCYDRFYGPSFRNGVGTSIEITVKYADGAMSTNIWPPCREGFTGKTDDVGDAIQEIEIRKEGEILYRLDAMQARILLERENAHDGYSVWNIAPGEIRFETSPESHGCSRRERLG